MKMSKLTDFYAHKAAIIEKGEPIDPQWEQLEDQLLKEELLPELIEQLKTVLSKVKSPLMFSGSYDPNGCLSVSFTRNCMQVSTFLSNSASKQDTFLVEKVEDESEPASVVEEAENNAVENMSPEPRSAKAKSIGFSVSFRDGTVYHDKKAVNTWIQALKKIGLETICNNRSKHTAWHRVNGRDICIVERTETVRDSDGKSPQTLVDGFYVMTQLSNEQKEKDLLALGEYMPKLGIKVIWDDENPSADNLTEYETKPVINEEASRWLLPINEQFRSFLFKKIAANTAKSYYSTIDNAVRDWIRKEVDEHADSVFSYTSSEDVRLCIEILKGSSDFNEENARRHNSMTAALNQYLLFIQEWEKLNREV